MHPAAVVFVSAVLAQAHAPRPAESWWRGGRGSRRGRRVDPGLGLTLGSRPSILPIATRDIAAGSGTPPTSLCTYPQTPPTAAWCATLVLQPPQRLRRPTTPVSPTARANAPGRRQQLESNAQSIVPAFNMPLCGGTKSVQRKLVLLYVPIAEPGEVGRIPKPLDQTDAQLTAATAHAARHRY